MCTDKDVFIVVRTGLQTFYTKDAELDMCVDVELKP